MERRGEDRDIAYNIPPESHSPLKLPLAPIISTPPDRRGGGGGGLVSTRRGSAIFSPTQTLDHHPPKLPSPDPDPSTPIPNSTPLQLIQLPEAASNNNSTASASVRYRECLKNHAATMGGHVVDGCGEFMPNGEDGTVEALRCAACDCHRNFHRKEADGEITNPNSTTRTPLLNTQTPVLPVVPLPANHHQHKHPFSSSRAMVSFGADESSSEDLSMFQSDSGGHAGTSSRKRFRTKFSQEQKDRMQEVAEKLGWRIQKQDEQQVQQLCTETGVKRQVFKVWMHNNKQAMKKRELGQ